MTKEELKNIQPGDFVMSKWYTENEAKYKGLPLIVDYVTEYSAHCVTLDNYASWLISYEDIDSYAHPECVLKEIRDMVDPRITERINNKKEKRAKIAARKNLWRDVCNEYLEEFCKKHGYSIDPYAWVHDDCGTMANVCDMFLPMEVIRFDIDNDVEESALEEWYWKNLEIYELTGQNYMSYESFVKGAPDPWTKEKMESIRAAHKRVEDAQKSLNDEIERIVSETKKGNKESNF